MLGQARILADDIYKAQKRRSFKSLSHGSGFENLILLLAHPTIVATLGPSLHTYRLRRSTRMAEKYDLLTYDTEEERIIDPVGPPPKNLIAAAEFLDAILLNAGIPYAIMGGFALFLRASNRPTQDIDVVVDSSPRAIWNVIETQERHISSSSLN